MSIMKILQKIKISKNKTPRLQEYFFREALAEVGITSGKISIDHMNGNCWHEDVGTVPIIFPIKRIDEINKLRANKKMNIF